MHPGPQHASQIRGFYGDSSWQGDFDFTPEPFPARCPALNIGDGGLRGRGCTAGCHPLGATPLGCQPPYWREPVPNPSPGRCNSSLPGSLLPQSLNLAAAGNETRLAAPGLPELPLPELRGSCCPPAPRTLLAVPPAAPPRLVPPQGRAHIPQILARRSLQTHKLGFGRGGWVPRYRGGARRAPPLCGVFYFLFFFGAVRVLEVTTLRVPST